jgi:hypothetical protein
MQADQHRIRLEADGVVDHRSPAAGRPRAAIDGWIAAVSSLTPSPLAPKLRTLAHSEVGGARASRGRMRALAGSAAVP